MSASELSFWEAFERCEGPIGHRRDDQLAGFHAWASGNLKKGVEPHQAAALVSFFHGRVIEGVKTRAAKEEEKKKVEGGDQDAVRRLAQKVFAIMGAPPDDDRQAERDPRTE